MRTIDLQIFDAFTDSVFGGNIAGIVSNGGDLTDGEMQLVAREIGVPVTGFLVAASSTDFGVRFFTPSQEINMCGHAIIALGKRLLDEGKIKAAAGKQVAITLQTNSGVVPAQLDLGGPLPLIMMGQQPPVFRSSTINVDELCRALGMAPDRLLSDYPLECASGALDHLFVPVRDLDSLAGLQPDFAAITSLSNKIGVMTIDVFTMQTLNPQATVHSRDFCPAAGINEAAGSGTTNSALFCYLTRNGLISAKDGQTLRITAEQGYEMGRPSQVQCEAIIESGDIRQLKVGGTAVMSIEGRISIPAVREQAA
jgi:trans-2,3-dihydro-3-hydroxyanthranilate isomerase